MKIDCYINIITFKEFMEEADNLPERYILPQNFKILNDNILGFVDWNYCFRPIKLSSEAAKIIYNN